MTLRKGTIGKDLLVGGLAAESFDGLGGYDIVSYGTASSAVTIDLLNLSANTGAAAKDTYASIEAFRLTRFDDLVLGSNLADSVNGFSGNDRLDGRSGDDGLNGHEGNDTLIGGAGDDGLWGGAGADVLSGGTGKDLLMGDSGNDRMDGGDDTGAVTLRTVAADRVVLPGGISVALSQIDSKGEVALLSTPWSGVASNVHGVAVTYLGVIDGDMVYAVSNRMSFDTNFALLKSPSEWSPSTPMYSLPEGATALIDMGAASGGPGLGALSQVFLRTTTALTPMVTQSPMQANLTTVTTTTVSTLSVGDTLNGGFGSDAFVFTPGASGVDRINGFIKGQDHIDVAASWFDGNVANGEFKALSYAGGSFIAFADRSSDGFVDDTGIFLAGVNVATVDRTFFI